MLHAVGDEMPRHSYVAPVTRDDRPSTAASNSLLACAPIIAIVATGFALNALAGILVPLALAIFLLLLVEAVARATHRVFPVAPGWLGIVAGLVAIAVFIVASVGIIALQAGTFVQQAYGGVGKLEGMVGQLSAQAGGDPITVRSLLQGGGVQQIVRWVFRSVQGIAGNVLLVALYLGFLVAARSANRRKFTMMFESDGGRRRAADIVATVRRGTEQYVWVQTTTGLLIAGVSWAVMAAFGLQNAALLALVVFLTSYLPVVGPLMGVLVPPVFALAQFDGLGVPIGLGVLLQAINFAVNNVLVPRMQADRLNIDPVSVLLGLGFWTLLWGLPGAFLSTPLTVAAMALAAASPTTRWIAVLMSKDPRRLPPVPSAAGVAASPSIGSGD